MKLPPTVRPSLVRTITLRLALTSLIAIFAQLAIVVVRSYVNEDDLNRSYVTREAKALLRGLQGGTRDAPLKLGRIPPHYEGAHAASYSFRMLRENGQIVAERNGAMLAALSPWREKPSRTQDLWLLDLDTERKLQVAGGLRQKVGDTEVWVEVATAGDPDAVYLGILAAEVLDDVWISMIPLIAVLLGVAVVSIRRSLSGLVRAAAQAELITPLDNTRRFDVSGMPREAATLAIAINDLLDRVGHLVKAQRLFIARAAHELRTPLAVMMLELGRSEDPRVRRLEADVQAMGETVDRLLTLARLESIELPDVSEVDVGHIATEMVERLKDWAAGSRHRLTLAVQEPARLMADAIAVREALRNLIENAVRHTPPGTDVRITVGPAGAIVVEDDGPGLVTEDIEDLFEPFKKGRAAGEGAGLGLAIVKQAVDLHHGRLEVGRSPSGGARFALEFPAQPLQPALAA
jgi:signal transduction histidine kinase